MISSTCRGGWSALGVSPWAIGRVILRCASEFGTLFRLLPDVLTVARDDFRNWLIHAA
jgi:hypothetical protein